jgi:signal transduction histidine kinase
MLLEMINDLLDLAKIEAGKIELRLEKVSPAQVTEAVVGVLRPLVDKKHLELDVRLAEGLPIMTSDPGKIQQILYNLLSNAVKFTPPGGQVGVAAEPAGDDRVQWKVFDTGPGIPPDELEHIFEKFRQVDASVTREHTGSGLGLAISKDLATMLGGQITVASKLGQGATLTVTLPTTAPDRVERQLIGLT